MRRKESSGGGGAAAAAPTKGVARSFGSVEVVGGIDRTRSTTTWLRNGITCSQAPIELHQGPQVLSFSLTTPESTHTHTNKQTSKQTQQSCVRFQMELSKHSHKHNSLVLFSNGIGGKIFFI
jgi:hypothetical protein